MTQYLLAVHMVDGEPELSADEMEQCHKDVDVLTTQIQDQGAWVFAGGLHPADCTTVVRSKGCEIVTTDGPFAETKEQLAGYYLIEAPDLDAALAWAARCPAVERGSVEVRPIWAM